MENLNELKTVEDAAKVLGIDLEQVLPDFSRYPEKHRKSMEAHAKIVLVVEAANQIANGGKPWVPDFDDSNPKYEIWWTKGSSGFRYYDFGYWASLSIVGSRLCFVDRATAKYVGNQFEALYNDYLL